MKDKFLYPKIYFLIIYLISIISKVISQVTNTEKIKIYSKDVFSVNCDSHFFYISMNISSSKKVQDILPFELTLLNPVDLKFKCIIDTFQEKLNCFTFVPFGRNYRKNELFFHLFYYPPKLPGIELDINSFIKHSRIWANTSECGKDNYLLNTSIIDNNYWNEFSISSLFGGECQSFYEDKEQKNIFYFNMSMNIVDRNITNNLKDNNIKMKFVQDIKVPVNVKYKRSDMTMLVTFKEYAYCKTNDIIDKNYNKNIYFMCKINLQKRVLLNSVIKISSFYDKIYVKMIKKENEYELKALNIFFNLTNIDTNTNLTVSYLILDDNKGNNILCPNVPVFEIKYKKTGIFFGSYSNNTNRFTFYLNGSLYNGFKYENDSLVQLYQTQNEITFNLFLTDNTLISTDETDIKAQCIISSSTLYGKDDTLIPCIGEKKGEKDEIDLTLNYIQNKNNNFSNIIINWPDVKYNGKKKHIYSYKITALSLQQRDYICDQGNIFIFYINIYDLNKEPKINFDLPLFSPEGLVANCELFDHVTLMCSIDLRYKKILKDTKISLHKKGSILKLKNEDGNENIFIISDFTDLGKNDYYYINLKEDCGENVVLGTLKDMGFSKKGSVILTICGILFVVLIVVFFFVFIIYFIKVRCKRGKRIALTEESKL